MDWVKPKHRARQIKQAEAAESASASEWLRQLCDENVTMLQASLPIGPANTKHKIDSVSIDSYLQAMLWGTGGWEIEQASSADYLNELVETFATSANLGPTIKSKSNRSKKRREVLSTDARALQITHATKIGKWIAAQLPKAGHDPYVALTCAGWLHALPDVGRSITPSLWLDVLQCALTQVDRAWAKTAEDGLFPWIVWACEVPLALAKQLSHLGGKDRIVSETLNRIALILEQSTDNMQPLLSFGAQDLRAIVASMIRSRWAANAVGARKWYPPQRKALGKLGVAMLHLSDRDGKSLLSKPDDSMHDGAMWEALIEMCADNKKLQLAIGVAAPDEVGKAIGMKPARLRKDASLDASLPKSSIYWDKGSIACMRSNWRNLGSRVAIDFSSDVVWLDVLDASGQRILSGDWDVDLFRGEERVPVDVTWQEVCWFSDDDVDYLELECDLEKTCKIQRQLMLVKDDGLLFMADAIVSDTEQDWKVESSWTMSDEVRFAPESKTNEGKLRRNNGEVRSETTCALVLPVAMPEWRRTQTNSKLTSHDKSIRISTRAKSHRLYNPIVIALNGLSTDPAYTWRQLTIAEELVIQPRDIAEAFRVQVNMDQWIFYRSLTPLTRRTVMGLHLLTEFYAARFETDDGSFAPLIEVNPE